MLHLIINLMYPLDRRKIALHLYNLLGSLRKTALLAQTSHSTIARWLKNPERKPYQRQSAKSSIIIEAIRLSIQADPFISIRTLQDMVKQSFYFSVSKELVRVAIKRSGFSKKKARFHGQPKDLETKVRQFTEQRDNFIIQGRQFLSLDETSFGRSGNVIKGYSVVGEKCYVTKKHPRMTTESVIAIASNKGLVNKVGIKGSINQHFLISFLKSSFIPRSSVVLLDNAAIHKTKLVKETAHQLGIDLLYVPPYSPWFNPIEGIFSIVSIKVLRLKNHSEK